jgi:protein-S-isoprenylcysteine O-methyltransferase Ste14
MADNNGRLAAFVFKNRGLLLSLAAVVLVIFGRPSALSIALGLPLAIGGELVRCWAVGYSGVTTRNDVVTAPKLVTGGPYGYVRNPLYLGNFVTAAGFAIAFTGNNSLVAVYATIVPHEEAFLRKQFGEEFERYCERVPRILPRLEPIVGGAGEWDSHVLIAAESKTFALFGAVLVALAIKALRG